MSYEFIAFARACGVLIEDLNSDDKLTRCGTVDHPHSKNGAFRWDGRSGFVWAWDGDGMMQVYRDPKAQERTVAEKQRIESRRQALQNERTHLAKRAAAKAQAMLEAAKPGEQGYLQCKGLGKEQGLVLPEGQLFVPMRDVLTNELLGAQVITWLADERRHEKKYLYGMRSGGAVLRLGSRMAAEKILCEGFATGLSIQRAVTQMRLNAEVIVTFSDHNLVRVAAMLGGRRYVIADHDAPQRDPIKAKQNPGCQGQLAAGRTGLPWAMSTTEGWDANDEHVHRGLPALCALVMRARSAEPAAFTVPELAAAEAPA